MYILLVPKERYEGFLPLIYSAWLRSKPQMYIFLVLKESYEGFMALNLFCLAEENTTDVYIFR